MGQGALGWADRRRAWLAVALVVLVALIVNPVGYAGGGRDDTRYLEAALCWIESRGICLPHDHWTTRWLAIAPLAGAIALGGLSRAAVSLGTFPAYLLSVVLIGWLGALWFSRRTGIVAAGLFAVVPAVSLLAFRPNVDMVELSAQLAALGLATTAIRQRSVGYALAGGACAGLAVAARDTSLLFAGLAVIAWWLLAPQRRSLLIWSIAGFTAIVAAEVLVYALATGEPLLRFKLALAHGNVPSSELAAWVDTSKSPILNPQFIAGWKRTLGLEIWWPIDPWLNLLGNPQIGPWLLTAPLAVLLVRESLGREERRTLCTMGFGAVLLAAAIVYVLAIDPKSRAFLLPLSAACIALGFALDRLIAGGRQAFAIALASGLFVLGLYATSKYDDIRPLEKAATSWLNEYPGLIETDIQTRGVLILVRGARDLPLSPSGKPLALTIRDRECRTALARPIASGRISLEATVELHDKSSLCLVRYR